jgi:hypothetical protein
MMSTNTQKSSEDVRALGLGGARGNKSSDRLHRMAGGSSSTNLTQHKRSKSHSQLMSAAASGKKKKKEEREEDEDGWTSSSAMGTPEQSRSPNSDSGEDDEGLTMRAKGKAKASKVKDQEIEQEMVNGTTPKAHVQLQSFKEKDESKGRLKRNDTQVTLRGFETGTSPTTVVLPNDSPRVEKDKAIDRRRESEEKEDRMAHSTSGSDDTLAQDEGATDQAGLDMSLEVPSESRPSMDRGVSTTSEKTLTADTSRKDSSSPVSLRTQPQRRTSLFPRDSRSTAAPKLSTQYALAGALGSLQEDSNFEQAMSRRQQLSVTGMPSRRSESSHLRISSDDITARYDPGSSSPRRKSSISSIRSNMIRLPTASPSMGDISMGAVKAEQSQHASGSTALDAMQRASHSGFLIQPDRKRVTSTHSLSAADAAKLSAKLRMARGESFDEAHTTSATKLLANSSSKYFTLSKNSDRATTQALKEYNKPTVSIFVNRLGERKNVEVKVGTGSLFDGDFSRAKLRDRGSEDVGGSENDKDDEEVDQNEPPSVRYVMDFGLSGPAVHKTPTTEALLSTLLDHDEFEATWAPALANAAGLGEGTRRAREAARDGATMDNLNLHGLGSTGGVAVNGPNATPMHFLHGLTNTTDAPFPLEPADMATSGSNLNTDAAANEGEYLDAKNLRAIAMTWTALNVNKSHVVTRRYVDPMRESLERVSQASGLVGGKQSNNAASGHHHSNLTPTHGTSGTMTPGGSLRWSGWRNLFSEHHTLQEES